VQKIRKYSTGRIISELFTILILDSVLMVYLKLKMTKIQKMYLQKSRSKGLLN